MNRSTRFVVLAASVMLLAVTGGAGAQSPPAWTDVLNLPGYGNIASGNYFQVGATPQPSTAWSTDLHDLHPTAYTVALSVTTLTGDGTTNGTGHDPQSGSFSCGAVNNPASFIESGLGTGIKGVGFYGKFNAPAGGVPLTYYANENLFEAVFFHEDSCYGLASDGKTSDGSTSREYGFFLSGYGGGIYAYWGTHENQQGQQVQAQFQLPGVHPSTMYYFEMYPAWQGSTCGFYVVVLDTGFNPVYPLTFTPVNSYNYAAPGAQPTITQEDSGFCSAILASGGASGYVSGNIVVAPSVTGTVSSSVNTYMERVFVGK
jgi:hypothetical protein